MNIALIVPVLIIVAIYYFSVRNSLITKFNRVEQAYQNLEDRLEKRSSAIPGLIKMIESHFDKTDKTLIDLKTSLSHISASRKEKMANSKKQEAILSMLKHKLSQIPSDNQNFAFALASLNEHEEQLSASRRSYNAAVKEYNVAIEVFPSNMIANSMNLGATDYMNGAEETLVLKELEKRKALELLDRDEEELNS